MIVGLYGVRLYLLMPSVFSIGGFGKLGEKGKLKMGMRRKIGTQKGGLGLSSMKCGCRQASLAGYILGCNQLQLNTGTHYHIDA